MRKIYLFLILIFFMTGCVRNIDSNGLVMRVDESDLNSSSKNFPIKKDFIFANVDISQPKLFIEKGANRINANLNLALNAILVPKTKGVFEISGIPYFEKEKSAVFLKDIKVEKLEFNDLNINKTLVNMLLDNLEPVVEHIFKEVPIYKIDKSSFKGSFVKDVKIEDSELLVTFGL